MTAGPPQSYTVEARVEARGSARVTVVGKAAEIAADTSDGQDDARFGPADLLLAAFAACALKNVERMARLQPFSYRTASITVTGEREDRPPRMTAVRYTLRVVTDEPDHRVDLLHRNIRTFSTVYNTLAAACTVSGDVIAVRDA